MSTPLYILKTVDDWCLDSDSDSDSGAGGDGWRSGAVSEEAGLEAVVDRTCVCVCVCVGEGEERSSHCEIRERGVEAGAGVGVGIGGRSLLEREWWSSICWGGERERGLDRGEGRGGGEDRNAEGRVRGGGKNWSGWCGLVTRSGEVMEREGRDLMVFGRGFVRRNGSSWMLMSLIKVEGIRVDSSSASTCFSSRMVSNSLRRFSISSRSSRWVRRRRFWSLARRWRVKTGSLPDLMRSGGGDFGRPVLRESRKSCVLWEAAAFCRRVIDCALDVVWPLAAIDCALDVGPILGKVQWLSML